MIEIKYFKPYTGKSGSIADALTAIGVKDVSLNARKKIATLNGIKGYSGTASQNMTLLKKLKEGRLIRSKLEVFPMREKFLGRLQKYQPILKKYGSQLYYSFPDSEPTFAKAEAKLKKGKETGLTCVVPCRWALKDIGIDPSGFTSEDGSFKKCYKGEVKKHLERIASGDVIGKTVRQAVDKGLLVNGDILTYKDSDHTFVYSGDRCYVYDGGRYGSYKDGILRDYTGRKEKISEILRWKD